MTRLAESGKYTALRAGKATWPASGFGIDNKYIDIVGICTVKYEPLRREQVVTYCIVPYARTR